MQKTALITGGGSGIGQAIAWKLAEENLKVYIIGRDIDKLKKTQGKFAQAIHFIQANLTELDDIHKIKQAIEEDTLDIIVQNAAIVEPCKPIMKVSEEELQTIMDINLKAPLRLLQALKGHLNKSRVLHISSAAAHSAMSGFGAYCLTKTSFFMLKELLNLELENALVGSVMPGIVDTNMQSSVRSTAPEQLKNYMQAMHSKKRLLKPKLVAQFLHYLLLETEDELFKKGDHDIYDSSHHCQWLGAENLPLPL